MSEQQANYMFRDFYIPERMMEGILRYIEHGLRPGRFLSAVICNQLKESCMYADDVNLHNIPAYASYFYEHAPLSCWGSTLIMEDWIKKHKIKRERKEYTSE